MKMITKTCAAALLAAGLLLTPVAASAADGVILIDQNRALAGNVTPGDSPGFPVAILSPGSYKLSGNLTVPESTDGIIILADDVTLDLNGFAVLGAAGEGHAGITDASISNHVNVSIRNGTIERFTTGIELPALKHGEVRDVRVFGGGSKGIGVGIAVGDGSVVTGSIVEGVGFGIFVGFHSVVSGNSVSKTQTALAVNCPSTVIGNSFQADVTLFDRTSQPANASCVESNNSVLTGPRF